MTLITVQSYGTCGMEQTQIEIWFFYLLRNQITVTVVGLFFILCRRATAESVGGFYFTQNSCLSSAYNLIPPLFTHFHPYFILFI